MEQTQRPPVMPSIAVILLTVTAGIVVLFGMRQYADILGPLLLTVNLFIAAYPVYTWLVSRKVPRLLAQVVLALTVFAILALFAYALTWSITALVQELPRYQPQFWKLYHEVVALMAQLGISEQQVVDQVKGVNPSSLAGLLSSALGSVTNVVSLLAVIVVLVSQDADNWPWFLGGLVLAWLVTAVTLYFSGFLQRVVGTRALVAVERLMGMILVLLAVQMMFDGTRAFFMA